MQKPQDMEPIKENEEGLSALSSSLVREDETAELDNLTECNHWASVYQGPLTQALQQLVTKESLSKVKVNKLGRGDLTIGQTKTYIDKFNQIQKDLKPSVAKLLNAGIREFARKNGYKSTSQDKIQRAIVFPLRDYMKLRGVHDKREARRQIKTDCEALLHIAMQWEPEKWDNIKPFAMFNLMEAAGLDEHGNIILVFSSIFADYLVNHAYEMKLHDLYWRIDDNRNRYAAAMLFYITTRKRQTRGRKGEDIISVRALAESAGIPIDNRKFKEKVIIPMERDLDALDEVLTWEYCKAKGMPFTDDELTNALSPKGDLLPDAFRKRYIKFTWRGYPLSEYGEAKQEINEAIKKTRKPKKKSKKNGADVKDGMSK